MNWTIHKRHFSHMTGILDLMHALSYAYRAARVIEDSQSTYQRWAKAIWQGRVDDVIEELQLKSTRITTQKTAPMNSLNHCNAHSPITKITDGE